MAEIVGIDPGFSGGICIMDSNYYIVNLQYMPTLLIDKKKHIDGDVLVSIIKGKSHVFIEKAQVMPCDGRVAAGNYMKGFGIIIGICMGLEVSYTLIRPQEWKKRLLSDMPKEKGSSVVRVKQLYPSSGFFDLKKSHNLADAVLIARYGLNVWRAEEGRNSTC